MGVITDVTEHHPMHGWIEAEKATASEPRVPKFYPYGETLRYCVGVDLGQSADPTAIAVLAHAKGVIDHGNSFERAHGLSKQTPAERIDVRHLERVALGTPYPAIVQHVADLLQRPPLNGHDGIKPAQVVIDETGVGRAVGDIFDAAGLSPIRVSITAGAEVTNAGIRRWHVSKSVLISTAERAIDDQITRSSRMTP
jgi:hypothetical protein